MLIMLFNKKKIQKNPNLHKLLLSIIESIILRNAHSIFPYKNTVYLLEQHSIHKFLIHICLSLVCRILPFMFYPGIIQAGPSPP